MQSVRSTQLLSARESCLVIIDVQEKLLPVIERSEQIEHTIRFLCQAATLLNVPVVLTEQYPRGLGVTVSGITELVPEAARLEKLRFSAGPVLQSFRASQPDGAARRQVVLAGIETHICVLQTALDLASTGCAVFVVEDGIGSRNSVDRMCAIERLRAHHVMVLAAESVVFEWCESADHPQFRELSRLVRSRVR